MHWGPIDILFALFLALEIYRDSDTSHRPQLKEKRGTHHRVNGGHPRKMPLILFLYGREGYTGEARSFFSPALKQNSLFLRCPLFTPR